MEKGQIQAVRVSDLRYLFDTYSVGVTISIPLDLLEDGKEKDASCFLVARLIQFLPELCEEVLDYKKLTERLRK